MIGTLQKGASRTAEIVSDSRELAQGTVERTKVAETALNAITSDAKRLSTPVSPGHLTFLRAFSKLFAKVLVKEMAFLLKPPSG